MRAHSRARNGMTRRRFAAWAIGLPAAATLGTVRADAAASDAQAVLDFRARSARLTGFSVDDLDVDLASALLRSLVATGRGDELRRLASAPAAAHSALAADIVAAWYSGVHPSASGPVVATYDDALVWPALGFAQPRGVCGVPGSWAARPAL